MLHVITIKHQYVICRAVIPSRPFSTGSPDVKVTTRAPPPFSRVDSAAQFTVTKLDDLINWAHRVSASAAFVW